MLRNQWAYHILWSSDHFLLKFLEVHLALLYLFYEPRDTHPYESGLCFLSFHTHTWLFGKSSFLVFTSKNL